MGHAATARGHSVTALFAQDAQHHEWTQELGRVMNVDFIDTSGGRGVLTARVLRTLRARLAPATDGGIVHTHFATFDIPAALMRLSRRDLGIFWHEHGPLVEDPTIRRRNGVRYAAFGRLVDAMLCVSPELRVELAARHAPVARLLDFPNAIDTSVFTPATPSARRSARERLGLSSDARVVLHFGWDWERKGGDLVLGAAERLRDRQELVFLTVLGSGAALPLDAPRNVRGLEPQADVPALYAAADVFLSVSRAEGALPLAAMEALACGLGLVVTNIPMQRRLIEGLPGARAVPARADAIADAIEQVLALDETQASRQRELVDDRFAAQFALQAWGRRLVDLYEQTISARA